jgi:hypothetical protein
VIRRTALSAVLILAIPCLAGSDREFNAVVKAIETQFGVHPMRLPLLGFATFCFRVAGTPRTSGLKIAVFEHVRSANDVSGYSLEQSVESAIGDRWRPLVRVRSRGDGELTLVYANPGDKNLQVLVFAVSGDDATVVQAKVKPSQIRKWIYEPDDTTDFRSGEFNMDVNQLTSEK